MKLQKKIDKILEVESERLCKRNGKIYHEMSQFAKDLSLYGLIKDYKVENKILIFKYLNKNDNNIKVKKIQLPKINMFNYFSQYLKNLKKEIQENNENLNRRG